MGGVSIAQETDTKWLVGVWEGEDSLFAFGQTHRSRVRVEFKEARQEIRWERSIEEVLEGGGQQFVGAKARGTAKVSGDSVTLDGQYVSGATGYLWYSLTRTGEELTGTGIGALNIPFRASWKKVK